MDTIPTTFIRNGKPLEANGLREHSKEIQYKGHTIRTYLYFCVGELFYAYKIFKGNKLMLQDEQGTFNDYDTQPWDGEDGIETRCIKSAMFEIEEQLAETVEPNYKEGL